MERDAPFLFGTFDGTNKIIPIRFHLILFQPILTILTHSAALVVSATDGFKIHTISFTAVFTNVINREFYLLERVVLGSNRACWYDPIDGLLVESLGWCQSIVKFMVLVTSAPHTLPTSPLLQDAIVEYVNFVRKTRLSGPDDLLNSVGGGIMSGAILGRLQGGQLGAGRYAIIFVAAGTAIDYATLRLQPVVVRKYNDFSLPEWSLPEWSPIQVLDEEALAAKRAREQQQLCGKRTLHKLNKEESQ